MSLLEKLKKNKGGASVPSDPYAILRGRRILLVEDNALDREITFDLLTDKGAEVTKAWNGSTAIRILRENKPGSFDCILMDLQMPVMDGYEATRRIRKLKGLGESIPIIALTSTAEAEARQGTFEIGMDAFIPKPIDLGKLMETLRFILPSTVRRR